MPNTTNTPNSSAPLNGQNAELHSMAEALLRVSLSRALTKRLKSKSFADSMLEVRYSGSYLDAGVAWVAMYDFFNKIEVLDIEEFSTIRDFVKAQASSVAWYENVLVVSRRHHTIHVDKNTERLHCTHAPALEWADGLKLYFHQGTEVSEKVIMRPLEITAEELHAESNAEIRRIMVEQMGADHHASLLDLTEIDRDTDNNQTVRLLRTRKRDEVAGDYIQYVHVVCPSTNRNYYLCVPADIKTAWEAVAWTFGKSPQEYKPIKES